MTVPPQQPGPAGPGGEQWPPAGQQYGPPPGGQQYGPPPGGHQYGPPPGEHQYGPPPGEQYGLPPGGQYGPPPGGPSPRRRGRLPLLLGGIGALLAVVLVVVLLAVFAGGSSPRESAEAFVGAFNERDADGVRNGLCEAERRGFDEDAAAGDPFGDIPDESVQLELRDVRETGGDAAEADLAFVGGGEELPVTVQLVEEDGEWRVCEEVE